MTDHEYARRLNELDRLLNDPDVPMDPSRVWSLLADLSRYEAPATPGHEASLSTRVTPARIARPGARGTPASGPTEPVMRRESPGADGAIVHPLTGFL